MDALRQRVWIAVIALVAMLGSPLAALLCCRALGHAHDDHEHHAATPHDHPDNAADTDPASAGPVASQPEEDCPLVELPPARLAADQQSYSSPPAPLVVGLVYGRGPSVEPAAPNASLELRSRDPPGGGRRVFIHNCSLLI